MIQVLVVSDHPMVRAGLSSIIRSSQEFGLVGEVSLDEMVSQATTLRPDVILMEAADDEVEGSEAVWRLATEMADVGTIVISRDSRETRVRQVLQAGARGYLLWDASAEDIIEAIKAVHQGLVVLHPTVAQAFLLQTPQQVLQTPSENLTARELEVLQMLAQGLPSKIIANRLQVSEHTVKFHVGSILSKLGAGSRTEAVTIAIRRGLITL